MQSSTSPVRGLRGSSRRRLPWLAIQLAVICAAVSASPAGAQTIDPVFPVTNGAVTAMALAGDTLYVAGSFSWLGVANGSMVALDAETGAPVTAWPRISRKLKDGLFFTSASTALPDGEGGCYVGGNFESVSGVARAGLAHVRADGTLDGWNPGLSAYGHIDHMVRIGATIYVGGSFSSVGGQPRNGLAAVDAMTGAVTPWNPQAVDEYGGNAQIRAMATDGLRLFVAGSFKSVGGQPRNKLAALDPVSALATPWNPGPNAEVAALAVDGGVVYAGGSFSTIGGQARRGVAALDPWDGSATPWDAGAGEWASVSCLAVSGSKVYVGGNFTQLGGAPRSGLGAVDAGTGLATGWQPAIISGSVHAIATNGPAVYLGGRFFRVANQAPCAMFAVDSASGATTMWSAGADQPVTSIAIGGSRLFASGAFAGCGVLSGDYLAGIDLGTGQPLPWHPRFDDRVWCLAAQGHTLYVGGGFTTIDGQERGGLAAFDRTSGLLTAWDPSAGVHNGIGHLATDGRNVYVESPGGATFAGHPSAKLAALDVASGSATAWSPTYVSTSPYQYIAGLMAAGSRVYLYGEFSSINGQNRHAVAAVNPETGALLPWDAGITGDGFNPGSVGYVDAAVLRGTSLFVSGHFGTVGGAVRHGLAAVDTATALATGWLPTDAVGMTALAATDSVVYAGSHGYDLDGAGGKNGLLAFDAVTGARRPWFPQVYGWEQYGIAAIVPYGRELVVGGYQDLIGGEYVRPNLLRIRLTDIIAPTVEVQSPAGGESFLIGSHQTIRWHASDDQAVASADLSLSRSGPSGPWELVAAGVTGATSYEWTVPAPAASGTCWLRVDVRDMAGQTTTAYSPGPFSVSYTTDVSPNPAGLAFSLDPPAPNPAGDQLTVGYALARAGQVRVSIVDVQGRQALTLWDGELAPGRHMARLAIGRLAPGIYFVRLRAAGAELTRRFVVVR